jgi:hypothetical protein
MRQTYRDRRAGGPVLAWTNSCDPASQRAGVCDSAREELILADENDEKSHDDEATQVMTRFPCESSAFNSIQKEAAPLNVD